jgi:hypothetical protein
VRLSAGALELVWVRLRAVVIAAGGLSVGGMWGAAQLPCEPVAAGSAFRCAKATASSDLRPTAISVGDGASLCSCGTRAGRFNPEQEADAPAIVRTLVETCYEADGMVSSRPGTTDRCRVRSRTPSSGCTCSGRASRHTFMTRLWTALATDRGGRFGARDRLMSVAPGKRPVARIAPVRVPGAMSGPTLAGSLRPRVHVIS